MVTFKGQPVTLAGTPLKVGDKMPDFTLVGNALETVSLGDTAGVRLFLAVPSLDTAVCDLEVRTFNQKVGQLGAVSVYTVSMDLPFAQKRWCAAAGIEAVKTLSDFRYRSFGQATGTLMTDIGLLARAVFVVNSAGDITYVEYVPEVGNPPDYEAAYAAVKAAQ
jgi:thiol peroxidase